MTQVVYILPHERQGPVWHVVNAMVVEVMFTQGSMRNRNSNSCTINYTHKILCLNTNRIDTFLENLIVRLLHSPSPVTIGLSLSYETWPPICWHHLLWLVGINIDWDCLVSHGIMGSTDWWKLLLFLMPQWQSLCTALTAGKGLPLGLCKGTVKESNS